MLIEPKALARIWASLKRRDKPEFKRVDLGRWLDSKSIDRRGVLWVCEYSREPMGAMDLSLDHKLSLAAGGRTTLDNLAVCTLRWNRIKGKLSDTEFRGLLMLMEGQIKCRRCGEMAQPMPWSSSARSDLLRRLGQKPSFRFKTKAKEEPKELESEW